MPGLLLGLPGLLLGFPGLLLSFPLGPLLGLQACLAGLDPHLCSIFNHARCFLFVVGLTTTGLDFRLGFLDFRLGFLDFRLGFLDHTFAQPIFEASATATASATRCTATASATRCTAGVGAECGQSASLDKQAMCIGT